MIFNKYFEVKGGNALDASSKLDVTVLAYCRACEEIAPDPEQFAIMCSGWQSEMIQDAYFEIYAEKHHGEVLQLGNYVVLVR